MPPGRRRWKHGDGDDDGMFTMLAEDGALDLDHSTRDPFVAGGGNDASAGGGGSELFVAGDAAVVREAEGPGRGDENRGLDAVVATGQGMDIMEPAGSDAGDDAGGDPLPRHMSLASGISMIVGLIIGSGVFSSPGIVADESGSIGAAMVVWVVAGILSLAGALCYAELGVLMPKSGGEFVYLDAAYGPLPAFSFVWAQALVMKPGSQAIIAIIFSRYFQFVLGLHGTWEANFLAFALVAVIAGINMVSATGAASLQRVSTVLKLAAVAFVACLGVAALPSERHHDAASFWNRGLFEGTTSSPFALGNAMTAALWSYDGFNNLSYCAGELKNPGRNLPLAIRVSLPLVIAAYMVLNSAYFLILPWGTIVETGQIAVDAGEDMASRTGAIILALAVAVSTVGACNGSVFSGSRVVAAAARDGQFPFAAFFGRHSGRSGTPINALAVQALISMVLIATGSFSEVVGMFSFVAWVFYGFTAIAVLVLRRSMPAPRIFAVSRATPVVFAVIAAFLVVSSLVAHPLRCAIAAAVVLLAIPLYKFVIAPQNQSHRRHRDGDTGGAEVFESL